MIRIAAASVRSRKIPTILVIRADHFDGAFTRGRPYTGRDKERIQSESRWR